MDTRHPRRTELHNAIDTDYDSIAALTLPAQPDKTLVKRIAEETGVDKDIVRTILAAYPRAQLDGLRQLHHRIVNVELDNPSTPDGYPTSVIGAEAPSGRTPDIPENERVTLMPTERAAANRERAKTDEYRRNVHKANDMLQQAAMSLRAVNNITAWCLNGQPTMPAEANTQYCAMMLRVGKQEQVARRIVDEHGTTIPLSAWAYNFRVRNRRLPTVEECDQHAKMRRVMVKAS